MNKDEILSKILDMHEFIMMNSFPYEGISKLKIDLEKEFVMLEDESLNADFNDFCTVIIGTTSYIFKDNVDEIPNRQINLLNKGFFERFPQYHFFESSIEKYPEFINEYNNHEKLRNLIIDYLQNN